MIRYCLSIILVSIVCSVSYGQYDDIVSWTATHEVGEGDTIVVTFHADISKDWKVYSQFTPEGGPIATSFEIAESADYTVVSEVDEVTKAHKAYSDMFEMEVISFKKKADFQLKILPKSEDFELHAEVNFMTCNGSQCLPPRTIPIAVKI